MGSNIEEKKQRLWQELFQLQGELEAVSKRRVTLLANLMLNLIKREKFDETHSQIEDQLKQLESKMAVLEKELEELHLTFPSKESVWILQNLALKRELKDTNQRLNDINRELMQQADAEAELEKKNADESKNKYFELKFCHALLGKYSELINQNESKSVTEVKALINPNDLSVQSLVSKFKTPEFNFSTDYWETAKKIMDFLSAEVHYFRPKFSSKLVYWFSPEEILSLKIADDQDLAILLCSCLKALGDDAAEVVIVELDNGDAHAFVATLHNSECFLLDMAQPELKENFKAKSFDESLKAFSFETHKVRHVLYKFNQDQYYALTS